MRLILFHQSGLFLVTRNFLMNVSRATTRATDEGSLSVAVNESGEADDKTAETHGKTVDCC
jgi:hypothetical protein